jgi:hypothetical protein
MIRHLADTSAARALLSQAARERKALAHVAADQLKRWKKKRITKQARQRL